MRKTQMKAWGNILAELFMAAAIVVMAGMMAWHALFAMPCRMERDCREQGVAVETLRLWEERDDGQILGLTGLAGWRVESCQAVASVSTGRRQRSQVMAVYGSMELVMAAEILSGRCGMDVEGDYCVLSRGLANSLFGSVDVAGECVKTEEKRYIVQAW